MNEKWFSNQIKPPTKNIFNPDIDKILLFHRAGKFFRLVFSKLSDFQSKEDDISFVLEGYESMFKTDYMLESNARQFLNLDHKSLLMVIGEAFSDE
jgi:hypothetical protein